MENGREDPGRQIDVGEPDIEAPQVVARGDLGADLLQTGVMGPEVTDGAKNTEGLLHAEDAVEGPFPVELDDTEASF